MSELTRRRLTQSPTNNGWSKHAADSPRQVSISDNRADEDAVTSARWVVAEYLRDVGLCDPELIARESHEIVERAHREPTFINKEASLSEAAIQLTVKQLDRWLMALAESSSDPDQCHRPEAVAGSRLPDLLRRYPQAWKQRRPTEKVIESLRDNLTPVVPEPRPRPMRRQDIALVSSSLRRLTCRIGKLLGRKTDPEDKEPDAPVRGVALSRRKTTRASLALLTILTTAAATWMFCRVATSDGLGVVGYALALIFAVLFAWVAFSFWVATLGLIIQLRRGPHARQTVTGLLDLPPTAIVMPIYNENPRSVFANIRAIAESLKATGQEAAFSIFVLSDTTETNVWLEEERQWAKLVAKLPCQGRVFYRHRPKNSRRKAGNIADFCSRWGDHHKYMIVLDADSLMAGDTLVEMVRRMERDPLIGILQSASRPINRQSFFARIQQFAAFLYGPIFLEGFVHWSECDGNYYGHNAIIRIQPFMEHCELPILPGEAPLGGEILSHDFVEAALMRRAGWKVCIAHDLDGSYEECPATVLGFAQRDQRWCQGNLQHIRLLLAEGLHPASRLHLGMGAMSFLASPLWFTFLMLTLAGAIYGGNHAAPGAYAPGGLMLFFVTMSLLLLPKVWSVIAMTWHPQSAADGVRTRAFASILIETFLSMLIAPIMMLLHTRFVISTLLGRRVTWNAQHRSDCQVSLPEAFAVHFSHTMAGLVIGAIAWFWAPGLLLWLLPVLAGLVLSIPLAMLLGSVKIGKSLARRGLLTIPEEVVPPPVLKYQHDTLSAQSPDLTTSLDRADFFDLVLQDPAFYALHVGILRATESHAPISSQQFRQIMHLMSTSALATASAELRNAVLNDWQAMESLHIFLRSHVPLTHSILEK